MPSFDDFELVEEEVEEEEQPSLVPESYFRDDAGREWCRVFGPEGVYWWMIGTSTVACVLAVRPGASGSVRRQSVGHSSYATVTGAVLWRFRSCRSYGGLAMLGSTVFTCSASVPGRFWKNSRFFHVMG